MLTTLDKLKKEVQDMTVDGDCSNCGQCCGNILPVGKREIELIRRYVKKHNIKEQIHRLPTRREMYDFTCPFRDDLRKKCLIYPVRPAICRDFQCDKPQKNIMADKSMYHEKCDAIDMRATFYGKPAVMEQFLMSIMGG